MTGGISRDAGNLDVAVKVGSGEYEWVTRGVDWRTYNKVVLEIPYATLLSVKVYGGVQAGSVVGLTPQGGDGHGGKEQTRRNGWGGSIEYSTDGGANYEPFVCTSNCTCDNSPCLVATTRIVVLGGNKNPDSQDDEARCKEGTE